MFRFKPASYGPVFAEALREPGLPELTIGKPNLKMRAKLQTLRDEHGFSPNPVKDAGMAAACRAALWLRFDFFEDSHHISQDLHILEGSYWHAILHRREPDPENAKYWFQRVRKHPIYEPLRAVMGELVENTPQAAAFLRPQAAWDAFAFVDLCEAARSGQADCTELCLTIQRREWELLFDYCFRKAIGME